MASPWLTSTPAGKVDAASSLGFAYDANVRSSPKVRVRFRDGAGIFEPSSELVTGFIVILGGLADADGPREKIAVAMEAPGVTVREAIDLVPDAVRYTLTYDDAGRYADGVLADVYGLKAEGFELIKLKNPWHAYQYKGSNSQWRRPDTGLRFEMQFHTPESLEAKELTHEAYERIRGQTISSTEQLELEAFQRRVNGPGPDMLAHLRAAEVRSARPGDGDEDQRAGLLSSSS